MYLPVDALKAYSLSLSAAAGEIVGAFIAAAEYCVHFFDCSLLAIFANKIFKVGKNCTFGAYQGKRITQIFLQITHSILCNCFQKRMKKIISWDGSE